MGIMSIIQLALCVPKVSLLLFQFSKHMKSIILITAFESTVLAGSLSQFHYIIKVLLITILDLYNIGTMSYCTDQYKVS